MRAEKTRANPPPDLSTSIACASSSSGSITREETMAIFERGCTRLKPFPAADPSRGQPTWFILPQPLTDIGAQGDVRAMNRIAACLVAAAISPAQAAQYVCRIAGKPPIFAADR